MKRRFIHVFAGMDALSVAKPDWEPIAFSEIEPFASAVLAHHHPNVPNLGDITKADFTQFQDKADIYAGGSPCQSFSIAGLRKSLQDIRGNLTLEYIRGFNESKCPIGLWENVPGVLTTDDNAFGLFVAGMVGEPSMLFPDDKQAERWLEAEFIHTLLRFNLALVDFRFFRAYRGRHPKIKWGNAGMVFGPKGSFAWRVLDAQYFSLPQRRERVFGVAFRPGNAHRLLGAAPTEDLTRFLGLPGAVLFEPGSVPRNTTSRRQTREKVTPVTSRGAGGDSGNYLRQPATQGRVDTCGCGGDGGCNCTRCARVAGGGTGGVTTILGGGNLNPLSVAPACLSHGYRLDPGCEAFVYESLNYNPITVSPTLDARCKDGPIRNQIAPFVACFQQNSRDEVRLINGNGQLAGAVVAEAGMKPQNYLAFSYKDYGEDAGTIAPTLRSGGFKTSHPNSGAPPAVVIKIDHTSSDGWGVLDDGTSHTLGGSTDAVAYSGCLTPWDYQRVRVHGDKGLANILRRFSPTECLRLQGFPDNYLNITYRGKPAFNGPKYRAIGNSWAVTVARWVGDRVDYVLSTVTEHYGIRYSNISREEDKTTDAGTPTNHPGLLTATPVSNSSRVSTAGVRGCNQALRDIQIAPTTNGDRGSHSSGRRLLEAGQETITLYIGGQTNNTQGEIQDLGGYRCYTAAYSRNYPEAHDAIGLVDSGAFSDSPEDRLTFEQALTRQLKWENTASTRLNNRFYEFPVVSHTTPFQPFARCRLLALFEWQAYALASYDLLIDEVWLDGAKIKRRWSEEDAKAAVTTTVEAARYLVSQRDHLQPRKLILGCQGVTADQYRECVEQILEFASPEDWIGLGGWCILGRMRSWLPTYWETLHQVIPLIAAAGIKHVHLYGSLLDESCAPLLWFCDQYGLTCSADSKRPIVDVTYPDRVRAGVRAATGYWRDNVQWWQNHFANMRQSKWYKEPPRQHQQLSILRPTVTTVTEPVLTQPEVAKPFLKWAGGKSWAIPLLQELYTSHRDRRYCDLTLGSGAIPLALQPDRAYLCDKNPFLIQLWEWVQTDGRLTIDLSTDKDYYLECRDRFNAGDLDQAQLFYYLNHTCWRGLYRSSKEKFFNVPWGDYKKFHGQTDLTHYKQVIEHWEFAVKSWEDAIQHIQSDDFVVFDPPYHSTDGAGFTQYFGAFTEADQIAAAEALSNLDVPIVAFNAATDFILDLYRGLNFTTQIKEAPRMISSTGDRAPASEMVATKNTEKKLISLTSYLKHRLDQPNDSALTTDSCQSDLSYDEQRDRIHLERKVEAAFYEAGKALKQLRDRRLYRSTHPTWEAYCQDRFGFSHQNGDKKIAAAKVVDVLTTNGCQLLPSSGEQAYPLSRLVDDEQKVEVWEELTQDGKRPSGKKVRNVVAEICDRHAERGDYHNPWQVGDICQIMKKGDGTLARYDGCWSIVSEVKTRQCVVKVWDKELLVKVENLEELVVGEEFLLVCDRVRSLMSRHMDGTITLKRGQLRFLEAMGEQVETFDPDDIEMLSCIEAKVNSCDASLVQAARLVADNVECLTSEEARSLFEALQATHGL